MSATIALGNMEGRRIDATLSLIQHSLIIVGLMVALGTFKPSVADNAVADSQYAAESANTIEVPETEALKPAAEELPLRLQRVLDFVSRRYRVAPEALVPIFEAAQAVGRERRLDPLLIIAIIGIESRFNPFAESASGAKGLMQVIPGYHLDKIPQGAGLQPFLDPVTNIQVGVHVLEEAIRWRGGLTAGLQHYGGAPEDPETGYANKVIAEKERLEQAARRNSGARV
ncbi:MAG: transglycosylase SLT domain-containing protein [Candidatus Accumulibacter phosphatis]|uniref:Murein transglycosylase C n=2 Tax=Candidatus Accumulibacter TaxID=327159 RepID=A0A080M646_9PROT|nr:MULTISPECIES: transglycosylase SLT domain-containing protein [Candidatus Accumulibacter]KFB76767.1 MAG: murein transglycosylase C [Candidatus Accumulibacter cognatus]MBL8400029.1 transglycosylase SLT domain-containing protein [Accumulibacter sp.]MBN8518247.1 transglycosylase SLT domain-containing protein [Accumulibacter sp.]MBO3712830.1 transglycosylase SLT domain-containing protein [Accumulibacter sp.]MCC2868772.1 transglycosylase SLT domain-containing protein [Candidatus Accumulibacter ph